ncbi:MAG: formylglycine-generating enzyme family protein [Nitrospira sp. CG24A]|nr:MAG: formylglycine-generating enzyme family protein [Nitrospira sp. CG24A]
MRRMLVLIALLGLAANTALAASPDMKGANELVTQQKQSQENPIVSKPPLGSMVSIPAGEFTMGSEDGDADERPAHKVTVDSFSIDVYEVTVGEYGDFLRSGGGHLPPGWEKMSQTKYHKRPVMGVDWADAAAYCKSVGKRLPTEAEWEKAARRDEGSGQISRGIHALSRTRGEPCPCSSGCCIVSTPRSCRTLKTLRFFSSLEIAQTDLDRFPRDFCPAHLRVFSKDRGCFGILYFHVHNLNDTVIDLNVCHGDPPYREH